MRFATALALIALMSGCMDPSKDAKIPGDPLGTFHVVGKLQHSSCGPGAVGSTDVWEFDMQLSKDGPDLYWLNGQEPIWGKVAADGVSFSFDTATQITLREPKGAMPGCAIVRRDLASGTLDHPEDISAFEGLMRFGYAQTPDSDCLELVSVDGGFATLPCEISYRVSATKTKDP